MKNKKQIILYLLVLIVIVSACRKKEGPFYEVPRIEYDVFINNYNGHYYWFDNIDGYSRTNFVSIIFDAANSSNFVITDADGNVIKEFDEQEALKIFPYIEFPDSFVVLKREDINALRFKEKWTFNYGKAKIKKEVVAFAPVFIDRENFLTTEQMTVYNLFWIYPEPGITKGGEIVITEKIAYDVHIDNSGAFINTKYGKSPYYFSNIETSVRKEIIDGIVNAGLKRNYHVCDYFFDEMTDYSLKRVEHKVDTLLVPISDEPGDVEEVIVEGTLNRSLVNKLKFIEKWKLNVKNLMFVKEIYAINPSLEVLGDDGSFRGHSPLFWIVYDEKDVEKFDLQY